MKARTEARWGANLLRSFDCWPRWSVVSALTVESIEDRQDLEVLEPSRRFLGSDDVAEVGDHDVDGVDLHSVSPQGEVFVSACNATRHERDVELTVGADEIPYRRCCERPAIVIKGKSPIGSVGADPSSELLILQSRDPVPGLPIAHLMCKTASVAEQDVVVRTVLIEPDRVERWEGAQCSASIQSWNGA